MECPACMKWLVVPMTFALAAHSWMGCSHSDMSGYRPARSHALTADREISPERAQTINQQGFSTDNPSAESAHKTGDELSSVPNDAAESEMPVSALVPVNVVDGANIRSVLATPSGSPQSNLVPENARTEPSDKTKSAAESRKIEILIKEKSFRAEPKTGALRVSFDDLDLLKILNMEPVVDNAEELMPEWLRGLDGKTIRVRGFMYPTYDTEGIEHFVLARDNQICCFGRDPKIYDLIQIDMKEGKTTNYIPATRSFDVIGKFRIQMQSEDGKPYGLYVIEQADVIDR